MRQRGKGCLMQSPSALRHPGKACVADMTACPLSVSLHDRMPSRRRAQGMCSCASVLPASWLDLAHFAKFGGFRAPPPSGPSGPGPLWLPAHPLCLSARPPRSLSQTHSLMCVSMYAFTHTHHAGACPCLPSRTRTMQKETHEQILDAALETDTRHSG